MMKRASFNSIDKIVLVTVTIIGFVGFFAFTAPDFVAFSSYIGLPFLILYPAPSVALYTIVFGIIWFSIGRLHRLLGLSIGLAAVWTIGFVIPQRINTRFEQEDMRSLPPDLKPEKPQNPGSKITLIEPRSKQISDAQGSNGCRWLCQVLLYSRSVDGVVIIDSVESGATKSSPTLWTIEQREQPCDIPRSAPEQLNGWKAPLETQRFVEARALTGECLVGRPTLLPANGLTVEFQQIGKRTERNRSDLTLMPPLRGHSISMTRKVSGKVRLEGRSSSVSPRRLQIPLRLSIAGSPNSGAYWEWSRERRNPTNRNVELDKWLAMKVTSITSPHPAAIRAAVDRWLNNPEVDIPPNNRALQDYYFRMVEKAGNIEEDLPRVTALIRDPRTERVNFLWMVLHKLPEGAPQLLDTILGRMLSMPADDPRNAGFAQSLESFPPSLFTTLNPKLIQLVQDPVRRPYVEEGVLRLGDAGPKAAPILINILDQGLAAHPGDLERDTIAAIAAICKIAPSIAPAYVPIEKLVYRDQRNRDRLGRDYGSWLWMVTRVRLGRPISTIESPQYRDTTWSNWKRSLQADVAEGKCDMR